MEARNARVYYWISCWLVYWEKLLMCINFIEFYPIHHNDKGDELLRVLYSPGKDRFGMAAIKLEENELLDAAKKRLKEFVKEHENGRR